MESTGSKLGKVVAKARKEKKLTYEALAEKTGLSKSYIWDIENNNISRPSLETVIELQKVLGFDLGMISG